eukprot:TRINITY_DN2311_c1_g1_i1.p3 TRINITY_DN2311_c1_g1~~TRINITY_DN2311_c1_g1_i1.p3  ORF type:complete len:295 (-),score=83.87 TRINITY_DN2311_c1_g1_i1:100-984(-)
MAAPAPAPPARIALFVSPRLRACLAELCDHRADVSEPDRLVFGLILGRSAAERAASDRAAKQLGAGAGSTGGAARRRRAAAAAAAAAPPDADASDLPLVAEAPASGSTAADADTPAGSSGPQSRRRRQAEAGVISISQMRLVRKYLPVAVGSETVAELGAAMHNCTLRLYPPEFDWRKSGERLDAEERAIVEQAERQAHTEQSAYAGLVRDIDQNFLTPKGDEEPLSVVSRQFSAVMNVLVSGVAVCVFGYFVSGTLTQSGTMRLVAGLALGLAMMVIEVILLLIRENRGRFAA